MKNRFQNTLDKALKNFDKSEWLGANSPLATPYFLGRYIDKVSSPESVLGRGEALQLAMRDAADSLWPNTLPQTRASLENIVNKERQEVGNGGPCYLYLLLDIRYLRSFFPSRSAPQSSGEIIDYLSISETRFFVHLKEARARFAKALLQLTQPSLRLEKPILTAPLIGRKNTVESILHQLQENQSISVSGVGGIGKTMLGTAIAEAWSTDAVFWYTFHPGLNDDLYSLIFSLGHFLHQFGYSNLWLQLMAQGGKLGTLTQTVGFLKEDLAEAGESFFLFCVDELDLLQTVVSQPRHSEHRQLLELLELLRKNVPLLLMGQNAIIDTDAHYLLQPLTQNDYAEIVRHTNIQPAELNLKRLHKQTEGNPRFLELYLGLFQQTENVSSINLIQAAALQPTFSRLWKRLTKGEKNILSQLAVFRSNAPEEVWQDNEAYLFLKNRNLIKKDSWGGIAILPSFRTLIYEQLSVSNRQHFHQQAAVVRSERGQFTEASHHLVESGQVDTAITFWFENQDIEIESGKSGMAFALFNKISEDAISDTQRKKLKIIKNRLDLLYGETAKVLKDIDKYSWHSDDELTAVVLQQVGEANFRQSNEDQALLDFENAIETLSKVSAKIIYLTTRRGQMLLEQGKPYEAELEITLAQFEIIKLQGVLQMKQGDYLKAKGLFESALQLAESSSQDKKVAVASYLLAVCVGNLGDPDLAYELAQPAMDYYSRVGDKIQLESLRAQLAGTYLNAGRFADVIEPSKQCLTFFKKMKNDVIVGHLNSNLAEALFETDQIDEAEKYAYEAIQSENPTIQPYAIYTLGQVHAARQKFDLAESAFSRGISLAQQIGDKFIEAYLYRVCGKMLLESKDVEKAKARFTEAIKLFSELNLKHEIENTKRIFDLVA